MQRWLCNLWCPNLRISALFSWCPVRILSYFPLLRSRHHFDRWTVLRFDLRRPALNICESQRLSRRQMRHSNDICSTLKSRATIQKEAIPSLLGFQVMMQPNCMTSYPLIYAVACTEVPITKPQGFK